jgi:hypothetical protein
MRSLIREPLPDCSQESISGPLPVIDSQLGTVVISEVELGQVPMKMLFGAVLIDALLPRLKMLK